MSNQSRQNQPDRSGQTSQAKLTPAPGAVTTCVCGSRFEQFAHDPGPHVHDCAKKVWYPVTIAHFTARELETLRKACRDSDFEHLWRDYVQPAIARAEFVGAVEASRSKP